MLLLSKRYLCWKVGLCSGRCDPQVVTGIAVVFILAPPEFAVCLPALGRCIPNPYFPLLGLASKGPQPCAAPFSQLIPFHIT